MPEFWSQLKGDLTKVVRSIQSGQVGPVEARAAGPYSWVGGVANISAQITSTPIELWVYATYEGGHGSGPRRVDLRRDSAGVFGLVGHDRLYTARQIAEYLLTPVAEAVLYLRDHEGRRRS